MSIAKRILGVIAGILVGQAFVLLGDTCSSYIHPWPKGLDYHNTDLIADFAMHLPVTVFLVMLAGYAIGSFMGGGVATLITGRQASRPAMIVGIVMTIGVIFNLWMIPHPIWFVIVSILVSIPAAWSGCRLLSKDPSA